MKEMQMTGERMVTSFDNHFGKYEHLHRYALASEFVDGKNVLDIACGEGYGANLLAVKAKNIIGVDISNETIKHASEKYVRKNISFLTGSASQIPCNDKQFDVVVSFETIEHHTEHELMFSEIRRVLKDEGMLLISSPEKNIYQLRDPQNTYHQKELTLEELTSLIRVNFKHYIILKQLISIGSLIVPHEDIQTKIATYDGDFYIVNKKFNEYVFFNKPFFNIILCSNNEINANDFPLASIYNAFPVYEYTLNEKDQVIYNLQAEITNVYSSRLFKILKKIRNVKNMLIHH